MKIQLIKYLDIDIDKIRKRNVFTSATTEYEKELSNRLLKIIDEFEKRNFKKALDLINALPYNEEQECSEKEYVPEEIYDFYQLTKDHDIDGYDYSKKL